MKKMKGKGVSFYASMNSSRDTVQHKRKLHNNVLQSLEHAHAMQTGVRGARLGGLL